MNVHILGSGHEVGRSAIMVDDILLDCGIKIQPEPPTYPLHITKIKPSACILTHAHLDHSGSCPIINRKSDVYMNDVTLDLSELLLRDSIKIAEKEGYRKMFSKNDLRHLGKKAKLVEYNKTFKINRYECRLYDAGHIPGSSGVLLENGKRIFYTGDIQTEESHLLHSCHVPKNIDILITESTYADHIHPDRRQEEKEFLSSIDECLMHSENALIPVFAVGRAQEILLILEKYKDLIAVDGMARTATETIAYYKKYLKDWKKLRRIIKSVHFIHDNKERAYALRHFPIIISSAGMLGGGPVVYYLKLIRKKEKSKVLFTGYLVEDTPGRNLIKTKIFQNAEETFKVNCHLKQFELSAHTDRNGLLKIIEKCNPEKIICVHGDRTKTFASYLNKNGFSALAPKNGEKLVV